MPHMKHAQTLQCPLQLLPEHDITMRMSVTCELHLMHAANCESQRLRKIAEMMLAPEATRATLRELRAHTAALAHYWPDASADVPNILAQSSELARTSGEISANTSHYSGPDAAGWLRQSLAKVQGHIYNDREGRDQVVACGAHDAVEEGTWCADSKKHQPSSHLRMEVQQQQQQQHQDTQQLQQHSQQQYQQHQDAQQQHQHSQQQYQQHQDAQQQQQHSQQQYQQHQVTQQLQYLHHQQHPRRERQRSASPRTRTSHSSPRRSMHELPETRSFRTDGKLQAGPLKASDNSVSMASRLRHSAPTC